MGKGCVWWLKLLNLCAGMMADPEEEETLPQTNKDKKGETPADDSSSQQWADQLLNFLRVCPVSQFHLRLRMIGALAELLLNQAQAARRVFSAGDEGLASSIEADVAQLQRAADLLANTHAFARRWVGVIDTALKDARQRADKEIKDLCKIVRWDLCDFNMLRDSVKRSHRQLAKIVRRFDTDLQEQTDQVLARCLADRLEKPCWAVDCLGYGRDAEIDFARCGFVGAAPEASVEGTATGVWSEPLTGFQQTEKFFQHLDAPRYVSNIIKRVCEKTAFPAFFNGGTETGRELSEQVQSCLTQIRNEDLAALNKRRLLLTLRNELEQTGVKSSNRGLFAKSETEFFSDGASAADDFFVTTSRFEEVVEEKACPSNELNKPKSPSCLWKSSSHNYVTCIHSFLRIKNLRAEVPHDIQGAEYQKFMGLAGEVMRLLLLHRRRCSEFWRKTTLLRGLAVLLSSDEESALLLVCRKNLEQFFRCLDVVHESTRQFVFVCGELGLAGDQDHNGVPANNFQKVVQRTDEIRAELHNEPEYQLSIEHNISIGGDLVVRGKFLQKLRNFTEELRERNEATEFLGGAAGPRSRDGFPPALVENTSKAFVDLKDALKEVERSAVCGPERSAETTLPLTKELPSDRKCPSTEVAQTSPFTESETFLLLATARSNLLQTLMKSVETAVKSDLPADGSLSFQQRKLIVKETFKNTDREGEDPYPDEVRPDFSLPGGETPILPCFDKLSSSLKEIFSANFSADQFAREPVVLAERHGWVVDEWGQEDVETSTIMHYPSLGEDEEEPAVDLSYTPVPVDSNSILTFAPTVGSEYEFQLKRAQAVKTACAEKSEVKLLNGEQRLATLVGLRQPLARTSLLCEATLLTALDNLTGFSLVAANVLELVNFLLTKGLNSKVEEKDDGPGENDLSKDDWEEGTGLGAGDGTNDVTDQIEDEQQLEGLKGDEETPDVKPPDDAKDDKAKEVGFDVGGEAQKAPEKGAEEDVDSDQVCWGIVGRVFSLSSMFSDWGGWWLCVREGVKRISRFFLQNEMGPAIFVAWW